MKLNFDESSGQDQKWKMQRRWVLTDGGHILVPIDDFTLRGFYIPTGRQVGAFADRNK